MFSILLVLLIIVSVFMTGLILLQKSEGSGMSGSSASSMLGGMLTGAAAGNFLTKLTAYDSIYQNRIFKYITYFYYWI